LTRIKRGGAAATHAVVPFRSLEGVVRAARFAGVLGGLVLAAAVPLAGAGDFERGKTLYNARCVGCHDRGVHNR
jgi:mono/diheme cytochrome c family protein